MPDASSNVDILVYVVAAFSQTLLIPNLILLGVPFWNCDKFFFIRL